MIPLSEQPVPADFDNSTMRRKGDEFLAKHLDHDKVDFKCADYWRLAAGALNKAYRGICAYTCFYIPGGGEVDHFLPKGKKEYRHLAYAWSNFRLTLGEINQFKGNSIEVLDPFCIEAGWFVIDFPGCVIQPGDGLSSDIKEKVEKTIKTLRLNYEYFVEYRCRIMQYFADGSMDMTTLKNDYPFLAAEIIRQGIEFNAAQIFKRHPSANKQ